MHSLSQTQAAAELGCTDRTIRSRLKSGKLTKTASGRIVVDQKFTAQFDERHLPAKN